MKHIFLKFRFAKMVWLLGAVGAVAALFALISSTPTTVHASNERIITIAHDGQQQIVVSNASTVSAVLKRAGVAVGSHDAVEPGLSTKLVASNYSITVYRAQPVTVIDGTNRYHIVTAQTDAKAIAQAAGLQVYDEDILQTSRINNFLAEQDVGLLLNIKRSTPVKVVLYDKAIDMRTQATTVQGFLHEKGLVLNPGDKLFPAASAPIITNMAIAIYRDGSQAIQDIPISFSTIHVPDPTQPAGYSHTQQQGVLGKRFVIYDIETKNGKTTQTELQSIVVSAPVDEIITVGTKANTVISDKAGVMSLAGIAPSDYQYADYIISHESGWCATKPQGTFGKCPAYTGSVPTYGGYGLCQSTPGSKMQSAGADWATNPVTQLRWCTSYANSRYNGWYGAYLHWIIYHSW